MAAGDVDDSNSKDLDWLECRPGRWERNIDEVEQFYTSLETCYEATGRKAFFMTGHITVSTQISHDALVSSQDQCGRLESAFKQAWCQLRAEQPTIAAWVEHDEARAVFRKVYEDVHVNGDSGISSLDTWSAATFKVIRTSQGVDEWCNSDPPAPALPTIFVLDTPKSRMNLRERNVIERSIVLRSPHNIMDGIGTLMLLNQLCKKASTCFDALKSKQDPQTSTNESKRLSPPFRIAGRVPLRPSEEEQRFLTQLRRANETQREGVNVLTIPFNQNATIPGKHQRVAITLGTAQTTSLLRRCKATGISVTHAYHSAIAMAMRDLQEAGACDETVHYICYCLLDERERCSPPFDGQGYSAAVYHSVSGEQLAVDLRVPARGSSSRSESQAKDFQRLAETFKRYYNSVKNDSQHLSLTPEYWKASTPAIPSHGPDGIRPIPKPNLSPSVSLSSLGLVDRLIDSGHGALEIDDPWVAGEELGTGIGCFLSTFRGRLTWSAAYNEAFQDAQAVRNFLWRVHSLVILELGAME